MDSAYLTDVSRSFLYHQKLAVYKWIVHGFSLRRDGISGCEWSQGFNEYQPSGKIVENRREMISRLFGTIGEHDFARFCLFPLRQVHSDLVYSVNDPVAPAVPPEGDGLVSSCPNVLLAIQTADCMPVLIVDPSHRAIAALHAGWRGTQKRIMEKVIRQMQELYDTRPELCVAVIGPSIRRCCYPVGREVVQAFQEEFPYADRLFLSQDSRQFSDRSGLETSTQLHLDLPTACRYQLLEAGLDPANLFTDPPCTACQRELFFSHRAEAGKCGRMISIIGVLEGH